MANNFSDSINIVSSSANIPEGTSYSTSIPTSTTGFNAGDSWYVTPLGTQSDSANATETYRFDGTKWVKNTGNNLIYSGTITPTSTGNTATSLGISSLPATYKNTTTGDVYYVDANGKSQKIMGSSDFCNTVYFNSTDPSTATIFDTVNPPVTNNDALKNLSCAIYIGTDSKTWISNGTIYSTYTVPSSTEWYLSNTTIDAGSNKTSAIFRNGKVGIGNNNPSAPLVVQGATGTGALKLIAPSVAAGDNWWLGFGHGTTSTDANDRARVGVDIAAGGSGRLFFTTGALGSQNKAMFIDENQKVGINTTNTSYARFNLNSSALGTNNVLAFSVQDGTYNPVIYFKHVTAVGSQYLQFDSGYSTQIGYANFVFSNGNVGINTNTPEGKLHVKFDNGNIQPIFERTTTASVASTSLKFLLNSTSVPLASQVASYFGQGLHFAYKSDTETEKSVGAITSKITDYANGKGDLWFIVNGNTTLATPAMIIKDSGNVGVNTTTPLSTLEVKGSFGIEVNRQTVNYTLANTDSVVVMETIATTATLPTPVGISRRVYTIKNATDSYISVTGLIEGTSSVTITLGQRESIIVQSDNVKWNIIAKYNGEFGVFQQGITGQPKIGAKFYTNSDANFTSPITLPTSAPYPGFELLIRSQASNLTVINNTLTDMAGSFTLTNGNSKVFKWSGVKWLAIN